MKVIKDGTGQIVAYRHWFKWRFCGELYYYMSLVGEVNND